MEPDYSVAFAPGDDPAADDGGSGGGAIRMNSDTAALLWAQHFREPERACARALALVEDPSARDPRLRAWSALTIAYFHVFFTAAPLDARPWITLARNGFESLGDRRGMLLAEIASARLAIVERAAVAARDRLLSLYAEAQQILPPEDRFWLLNAIGAAHYFTDELDSAIRYLYEALEALRLTPPSPQHPTVMSNLAAALVTVGDYEPARELAEAALAELAQFDNPQIAMFARSNLAEALVGMGDDARALATVDQMLAGTPVTTRRAAQNHYLAIAAEVYARNGRITDAAQCAATARGIYADFPGGFNEVHSLWADAAIADAQGPADEAIRQLEAAAHAAQRCKYLPIQCKAWDRLAERQAERGNFAAAYASARELLRVQTQRLSHRASAKYYLLRVEHELSHARHERDSALAQRSEIERTNRELERLNSDLQHKMIQIEALQAQLEVEAVHDPLTQLFNRRYLDSVAPGLIAASLRRGSPLALALVDLDHFKQVNDRYGHPAGDLVLREIGRVLPMSLRPADVVCRYGGEEFCIVLPDANGAGATKALASLAARLRDLRVQWNGQSLGGFTFSAGISVLGEDGTTMSQLLEVADRALYHAKDAGRDRILIADRDPGGSRVAAC
ncbi:MAG TPA: diguanylate cyclase [Casimicrobiaceae bacterium]|nr:diguanylate cyclase [Casimicrobiaceae bacterium]